MTSINQYDAIVIEDYGTKAYFQGPGPGISYAPVIGDLETPKVVVWSLLNDFLEKRINPYEEQFKNIHSATNDTVIGVLEDIFEK